MNSSPNYWQKWRWHEWFSSSVQRLPMTTRCVAFELLGRMWMNHPQGQLTVNGTGPMSDAEMAQLLHMRDTKSFTKHLARLLQENVFFRDTDGTLCSAKLMYEAAIADQKRDAAAERWRKARERDGGGRA